MTQKTIFAIFLLLFIINLICNLNNNDNKVLGDIKFFSKDFSNINTNKKPRLVISLVLSNLYFLKPLLYSFLFSTISLGSSSIFLSELVITSLAI
ncbi:hypothetical protein BSV1_R45 (plasmid) [Borreliella finlandensis]|uniref:Uncharacterized protein n=1 Tax=Borreliella finlandensis TaxID=498741 RepID=A0A806C7Y2_9SPIR|nr:hypothetical protein BSV1_R45 [Borreliella finlandensis]